MVTGRNVKRVVDRYKELLWLGNFFKKGSSRLDDIYIYIYTSLVYTYIYRYVTYT